MAAIREGNDCFAPLQLGMIVEETIDDPAAGAEFSFVAPGSSGSASAEVFRILGLIFRFVADGTAADRDVQLRYRNVADSLTVGMIEPPAGTPQTAGQTYSYIWMPNQPFHEDIQGAVRYNWLPAWWLIPGQRIETNTLSIQPGDQFSNITLMLQRWKVS